MDTANAEQPGQEFWTDELEELHEESSRTHFLDVWNRRAILERLGPLPAAPVLLDAGCSTGYLLEDLAREVAGARLIGLDYLFAGLPIARANVPSSAFTQADATLLPFADASIDAIVTANLLEHVPDDQAALGEFARVLRPGQRVVAVVPAGPGLYDYYDRYLHHQRRYGRGELAAKARRAGFAVAEDCYLGSLLYPPFALVKKRNRLFRDGIDGDALAKRVAADISATKDSPLGRALVAAERHLLRRGVRLPFGVRELCVLERAPRAES